MAADPTKDVFTARPELYAPSRLPPKAYELFRTRALVTDVIAQQCWLYVLAIARLHVATRRDSDRHGTPRVGIIGGGHMGCAIAMALLVHEYPSHKIVLSTRQPDRVPNCAALTTPGSQARFAEIPRVYDNARVSRECDVLLLCVPPSQLKSVAIQIKHALAVAHSSCVVVSILSGTTVETVQKACGTKLVLRTNVDVLKLREALVSVDEEQDDAITDDISDVLTVPPDALAVLRQQAEAIAVEHLTTQFGTGGPWMASPLARVLTDLTLRLDRSLPPSHATETVATVLCGAAMSRTTRDIDDTVGVGLPDIEGHEPPPLGGQPSGETAIMSDSQQDDEAEPHWLAAWTASLVQLQQAASRSGENDRVLD